MKKNTFYALLYIGIILGVTLCTYSCSETNDNIETVTTLSDSIENNEVFNTLLGSSTLIADETYHKYDRIIKKHVYYTENGEIANLLLEAIRDKNSNCEFHIIGTKRIIVTPIYLNYLFE